VRARIVTLDQRLYDYPWSYNRWYAAKAGRQSWFTPEWVLGALGMKDDSSGRRDYSERMRCRAVEELDETTCAPTRAEAGALEDRPFANECWRCSIVLLNESGVGGRWTVWCAGATVRMAARMLCEGLAALELSESDLAALPKGDPRKVALASAIGEHTIVSNEWIAKHLHLGHVSRASRCWKLEASDPAKSVRRKLSQALRRLGEQSL
jgi:hypothetical protein